MAKAIRLPTEPLERASIGDIIKMALAVAAKHGPFLVKVPVNAPQRVGMVIARLTPVELPQAIDVR